MQTLPAASAATENNPGQKLCSAELTDVIRCLSGMCHMAYALKVTKQLLQNRKYVQKENA